MSIAGDTQPADASREDAPRLMLGAVCACAKTHGIATITVTYEGSGHEGGVENIILAGPATDPTRRFPKSRCPPSPAQAGKCPGEANRQWSRLPSKRRSRI